jgi:hypothetical protein
MNSSAELYAQARREGRIFGLIGVVLGLLVMLPLMFGGRDHQVVVEPVASGPDLVTEIRAEGGAVRPMPMVKH